MPTRLFCIDIEILCLLSSLISFPKYCCVCAFGFRPLFSANSYLYIRSALCLRLPISFVFDTSRFSGYFLLKSRSPSTVVYVLSVGALYSTYSCLCPPSAPTNLFCIDTLRFCPQISFASYRCVRASRHASSLTAPWQFLSITLRTCTAITATFRITDPTTWFLSNMPVLLDCPEVLPSPHLDNDNDLAPPTTHQFFWIAPRTVPYLDNDNDLASSTHQFFWIAPRTVLHEHHLSFVTYPLLWIAPRTACDASTTNIFVDWAAVPGPRLLPNVSFCEDTMTRSSGLVRQLLFESPTRRRQRSVD